MKEKFNPTYNQLLRALIINVILLMIATGIVSAQDDDLSELYDCDLDDIANVVSNKYEIDLDQDSFQEITAPGDLPYYYFNPDGGVADVNIGLGVESVDQIFNQIQEKLPEEIKLDDYIDSVLILENSESGFSHRLTCSPEESELDVSVAVLDRGVVDGLLSDDPRDRSNSIVSIAHEMYVHPIQRALLESQLDDLSKNSPFEVGRVNEFIASKYAVYLLDQLLSRDLAMSPYGEAARESGVESNETNLQENGGVVESIEFASDPYRLGYLQGAYDLYTGVEYDLGDIVADQSALIAAVLEADDWISVSTMDTRSREFWEVVADYVVPSADIPQLNSRFDSSIVFNRQSRVGFRVGPEEQMALIYTSSPRTIAGNALVVDVTSRARIKTFESGEVINEGVYLVLPNQSNMVRLDLVEKAQPISEEILTIDQAITEYGEQLISIINQQRSRGENIYVTGFGLIPTDQLEKVRAAQPYTVSYQNTYGEITVGNSTKYEVIDYNAVSFLASQGFRDLGLITVYNPHPFHADDWDERYNSD